MPDVAKMMAHSIVSCRFDYANALLSGTTSGNLDMALYNCVLID